MKKLDEKLFLSNEDFNEGVEIAIDDENNLYERSYQEDEKADFYRPISDFRVNKIIEGYNYIHSNIMCICGNKLFKIKDKINDREIIAICEKCLKEVIICNY